MPEITIERFNLKSTAVTIEEFASGSIHSCGSNYQITRPRFGQAINLCLQGNIPFLSFLFFSRVLSSRLASSAISERIFMITSRSTFIRKSYAARPKHFEDDQSSNQKTNMAGRYSTVSLGWGRTTRWIQHGKRIQWGSSGRLTADRKQSRPIDPQTIDGLNIVYCCQWQNQNRVV